MTVPLAGSAPAFAARAAPRTVEVSITGVVQGVGFRPFVHRLALRHGVAGWVRNESGAVRILAEGSASAVDGFLRDLPTNLPPLARVDTLDVAETGPSGLHTFEVVASETRATGRLPVSPDVALCPACEREMGDPANRRHRYPFITCTDCGPRFTVIEGMPYDRVRTTMRAFEQCPECLAEYLDPADRRYHSETNSCPTCGPSVWLEWSGASRRSDSDAAPALHGQRAIEQAGEVLSRGGIVAVRGLGGFHLAVRADDEEAVRRLRRRKGRYAKPLAVMVARLQDARRIGLVSAAEAALLTSPERPIVLLERIAGGAVAESVSPGLGSVGVVLAYTPLHRLVLDAVGGTPLVMTSGNVSEEPIAIRNAEALERLAAIADVFLLHDREIVARYDDSVSRVAATGRIHLRRSRGYAPMPLPVPTPVDEPLLAVGPHLKNTFTLAQGPDAYVSQHIGDLENLETLGHFEDARERLETLFRVRPRWVVRDLHPGYLSTRLAEECGLTELPAVQHHHAHVAAVMAEHGRTEPTLGLAFDGTGYGTDGHVWGCEFLLAGLDHFERLAHLRYAPLPGGDRAARTPWRSLLGYASLDGDDIGWVDDPLRGADALDVAMARQQIRKSLNAPLASSLGRLFDAAAAVLGVRAESRYEGQAAMELEAAAGARPGRLLPFPFSVQDDGVLVLDPLPLLRALAAARRHGTPVEDSAADFHETVAASATRLALDLCSAHQLRSVALGGGCFQNARLTDGLAQRLSASGLDVLVPRLLGPNDGAVSYGQAVVAAAHLHG